MRSDDLASLGLRVKTGRAVAVLLRGPVRSPVVVKRGEIVIADSKIPETWQPYHVVMDLPWLAAQKAAQKTARAIMSAASKAMRQWSQQAGTSGFKLCAVGVVGGSDPDPGRIGNPHIRAHAAEGLLYRKAVESGADALGLVHCYFIENLVYEVAAKELKLSVDELKQFLNDLGKPVGRPWRSDEKAAALSAWLMLSRHRNPGL